MTKSFDDMVTAIEDVAGAISDDINIDPKNDFGMTVGDELHSIEFQLSRIADSLEILAKQLVDTK
jgi:hypothetical protein